VRDTLPRGTVTFLFTDVEGSTKLLQELGPELYAEALAELDEGAFNHACGLEILGETARLAEDVELARERFAGGLRAFAAIRDRGGAADCLDGLSRIAASSGDDEHAGVLRGVALELRETGHRTPVRADAAPPVVPEAAVVRGRALALEAAVEYAQSSVD
jgi:hypothetical protein